MTEKRQVRIGPEFFAKAKQDYADWEFALIREYLQNSIDAKGSSKIAVTIGKLGTDTATKELTHTTLVVENNGEPMTEDILLNKLLMLGGSGKGFVGTIGGFGKAKEILYFAHKSYTIRTGTLEVNGSGAEYTVTRDLPNFRGTRSEIVTDASASELNQHLKDFAALTQWDGELTVQYKDGPRVPLATNTRKGHPVRTFTWGKVYVSKQGENKLVVRAGGIPMFTRYIDVNRLVIVEIDGTSASALQSSRDALKTREGHQLDLLLNELAVDKRSALKDRTQTTYRVWKGKSLGVSLPAKDAYVALRESVIRSEAATKSVAAMVEQAKSAPAVSAALVGNAVTDSYNHSPLGFQFVVKSEDGKRAKKGYADLEALSENGKLLAIGWSKVLLKFWELFGETQQFNIGFLFGEAVAQYHKSQEYGHLFLVNPLMAGGKDGAKWVLSPERRWELVATAAHEFVHYKGFDRHDEDYTSYYSLIVEPVLLRHRDEFLKCFEFARVATTKGKANEAIGQDTED